MEPTIDADGGSTREAAASAVAADPVTAELLAKHSAGEKLTPAQYGKLGAFKARLKRWFGPDDSASGGQADPAMENGDAAPLASVEQIDATDGGLAAVPLDAGLVRRTTAALLSRCDSIAVRYVGTAARQVGAPVEAINRLERAAALSKDDKSLLIEIAPDVFTSLGVNPRHFPVAVFCGTMGAWATDLWLAVQEIKALKEKPKSPEPQKEPCSTLKTNGR